MQEALQGRVGLRRVLLDTLAITPSGALSPGPLSASAVAAGIGLGVLGGVYVALGHLVVELPYFAVLLALARLEDRVRRARRLLDLAAAGFMVFFAVLLLAAAAENVSVSAEDVIHSPIAALAAGAALTGFNAYFLLWWLTVGRPIVEGARSLGLGGKLLVYLAHYSYDLGWLALLAWLGGLGGALGGPALRALLAGLALVLLYYAARMALPHLGRGG